MSEFESSRKADIERGPGKVSEGKWGGRRKWGGQGHQIAEQPNHWGECRGGRKSH